MDWLSTELWMLLAALMGALIGSIATYLFSVRSSREKDKKARSARLRALEQEIKTNLLSVDGKNLTGQGGKPRLLANALQKSQEDWLTLETTIQENLQKLYSEISIYNDRVDLFFSSYAAGSEYSGRFFENKVPEIKKLLNACQADLRSITSHDPKN